MNTSENRASGWTSGCRCTRTTTAPHAGPVKRDELQWGDLAQDANKFLLTNPPAVAVERPFRADGAHFAWLLFQQPSRAAFAAGEMMDKIR